jgi:thiamine-monophosphate kinase
MADNTKLTSIASLGEFGLIDRIAANFAPSHPSTELGIGDDAAIIDHGALQTVVTTDLLVEGIHFDLAYAPLKHLGYKAVSVNVSDVYAMNATPTQITVSLAISSRFTLEAIDDFYAGVRLACTQYGIDLIGGDTSSSQKGLIISITALGTATAEKIVRRSTAKMGDLICVSGDLGAAYTGLQLLEREKLIFQQTKSQPQIADWDYIVGRQLRPVARKDIKEFFDTQELLPTAMIDISDGLSSELLHIAKQSGVAVKIFEDKIPIAAQTIDMAQELGIDPTVCAMNGGEDYELLFTIAQTDVDKVRNQAGISIIGHIIEGSESYLIARDGTPIPIEAQGWSHSDV